MHFQNLSLLHSPLPSSQQLKKSPYIHFGGFSVNELKAMNIGGFKSTFTLHAPSQTQYNMDINAAHPALQTAKRVVEGDLHANTRKLLELLFLSDLVTGVTPQQIKKLFTIATEAEWDKSVFLTGVEPWNARVEDYKTTLTGLSWKDPNRQLVLIGDVISDRGADDRLTISLIEKLFESAQGNLVILAGNHDLNPVMDDSHKIMPHQAKSELPGNMADEVAMKTMVQQYLSKTVLFHYLPEHKAFMSHAPLRADDMDSLIRVMNQRNLLPPNIKSSYNIQESDIQPFVESVNQFYQDTLKEYYTQPKAFKTQEAMELFRSLVWVRSNLHSKEEFPFRHIPKLKLIHGHDSDSKKASPYSREVKAALDPEASFSHSVVNLDNKYGKSPDNNSYERPLFITPAS
jgi:hypothetical protein